MFAIIHALLGGIIGLNLNSVWLVIFLSLASHFLLDMLPHWDGTCGKKPCQPNGKLATKKSTLILRFFDFSVAIITIIFLFFQFNNKMLILGAIFAILPDIAKIGYLTPLKKSKAYIQYLKFHSIIQKDVSWKLGLTIQLILLLILIIVLF